MEDIEYQPSSKTRTIPLLDEKGKQKGVEIIPPGKKRGIVIEDEDFTPETIDAAIRSISGEGSLPSGIPNEYQRGASKIIEHKPKKSRLLNRFLNKK